MNTNKSNFKTMKTNFLYLNYMKTSKLFVAAIFCLTLITSCSDDDDPVIINPEELITNVTLTFTNTSNATDIVTMTSVAPDGQDGSFTNIVVGSFTSGETYSLDLAITNESESPADDVLNDDIIPEADEHFFTYGVNTVSMTMSRDAGDVDGPDGNKLGVNTTWIAGAASNGSVNITLVHEPVGSDDSNNFGTVTGGEEDFNITFSGVTIN